MSFDTFNRLVSEGESSDDDVPLASPIKRIMEPGKQASIEPSKDEGDQEDPDQEQKQEENAHEDPEKSQEQEQIQNDLITSKIPMSSSIMLTKLPESTNKVISKLENFKEEDETEEQILKINIRCNPIGSTPPLKPNIFKISEHQHFSTLIKFIGKKLKRKEGVFVYLNNSFAPGPDEIIGNLYRVSYNGILSLITNNLLAFWSK